MKIRKNNGAMVKKDSIYNNANYLHALKSKFHIIGSISILRQTTLDYRLQTYFYGFNLILLARGISSFKYSNYFTL